MKIKSKKNKKDKKNIKSLKGGASFFDNEKKGSFSKWRRNTCNNVSLPQRFIKYVGKNVNAAIPCTAACGSCMGYAYGMSAPSCATAPSNCAIPAGLSHLHPYAYGITSSIVGPSYAPVCCAGIGCGVGTAIGLECCNETQMACNRTRPVNPYHPFGRCVPDN